MKSAKEIFDKAVKRVKLAAFKKGASNEPVKIKRIGYEWAPFGAIEGDRAKRIDVGNEDIFIMLYETPPGVFPPHFHKSLESGFVYLGSAEYSNYDEVVELQLGSVFRIPIDEWHEFLFLEYTGIVLNYNPAFVNGDWKTE